MLLEDGFPYQALGLKIRSYRIRKGFSQEKFADLLHTNQPQISMWERGLYKPSRKYVPLILKALEVSLMELPELERKKEVKVEVPNATVMDESYYEPHKEELIDFANREGL